MRRVFCYLMTILAVLLGVMSTGLEAQATSSVNPAIDEVKKSVVRIVSTVIDPSTGQETIYSTGSGFVIGDSQPVSYVVTNNHCVENAYKVYVFISRDHHIETEIKCSLPITDLAVLELKEKLNKAPMVFADSQSVKLAQTVYAIGFPGAADVDVLESISGRPEDITVTKGTVSKIGDYEGTKTYQTDAAINFGNSGGPLINEDGQVIGINYKKSAEGEGIGLAIQADELLSELDAVGIPYKKAVPQEQNAESTTDPAAPQTAAVPENNSSSKVMLIIGVVGLLAVGAVVLVLALKKKSTAPVQPVPKQQLPGSQSPVQQQGPVLKPTLRGISGYFAGKVIELGSGPVAIGRDPKVCQLVYPQDVGDISRQHCVLRYNAINRNFLLEDHSSNGTFLFSGERVKQGDSSQLNSGERFFLSDINHLFEVRLE